MNTYKNNWVLPSAGRELPFTAVKLKKNSLLPLIALASGVMLMSTSQITYADGCNDIVESSSFGGQLPLSPGMAVITHSSRLYDSTSGPDTFPVGIFTETVEDGYVLSVVDIRDPANSSTSSPSIAPLGENWKEVGSSRYVHSSWHQGNLGELFGTALEEGAEAPDIFVTPRTFSRRVPANIYPRDGGTGSEVFRIDGTTGAITIMKTLPGQTFQYNNSFDTFTGLAQVSFNPSHQVLYVSNLDDGKIYVLDASGASNATNVAYIGAAFDHGLTLATPIPDHNNLNSLWTPYGRSVWAVAYNAADNRLYYAVPDEDITGSVVKNNSIVNDVWSVAIDSTGAIDSSTPPIKEFTLNVGSVVISDISFNADGTKMLVTPDPLEVEYEASTDFMTHRLVAHRATAWQYNGASGAWIPAQEYKVGQYGFSKNSRGGGDFGFNNFGVNSSETNLDDSIVLTGDALDGNDLDIYGLQISEPEVDVITGVGGNTYMARSSNIGTDNTGGRNEKFTYGDVEVFGCTPATTVAIGDVVWLEDDNDGDASTGNITYPAEGTVVTATASDGTTTYTGSTDVAGGYNIEVPKDDTYTVTVATPTGFIPTAGSDDNNVPDDVTENNLSHDGAGTTVVVADSDNLTLDFGFTPPLPDLNLTKVLDETSAKRGDTVVYTLALNNEGDGDATGIKVSDVLPAEVSYVSHNAPEVYDDGTGIWDVGALAAGASRLLLITVTVK